ncbi:MAG: hypothetical protein WCL53_06535 [Chloroflexota bacterium]
MFMEFYPLAPDASLIRKIWAFIASLCCVGAGIYADNIRDKTAVEQGILGAELVGLIVAAYVLGIFLTRIARRIPYRVLIYRVGSLVPARANVSPKPVLAEELGTIRHAHVDWSGRKEIDGAITVGGPFCPRCNSALGHHDENVPGGSVTASESDVVEGPKKLHCWGCGNFYHFDYPSTVGEIRAQAREIFAAGGHLDPPTPEPVAELSISFPAFSTENGIHKDGGEYFISRPVMVRASSTTRLSAELEVRLRDGLSSELVRLEPLETLASMTDEFGKADLFANDMTFGAGAVRPVVFAFRIEPEDVAVLQEAVNDNPRSNSYRGHGIYLHLSDAISGKEAILSFGSGYPSTPVRRMYQRPAPLSVPSIGANAR